jgi:hypothetical protein
LLVAFDRTVFRDLHRPAQPIQDIRRAPQCVPGVEQAGDQVRHPGQGPALIVAEPVHGRAFVQRSLKATQPGLVETTPAPGRAFRGQGLLTTGLPLLPPAVHRGLRYPQPRGDLRYRHAFGEPAGRLPSYLLTPGPCTLGQSTTIGISHPSGVQKPSIKVMQTRRSGIDQLDRSTSVATRRPARRIDARIKHVAAPIAAAPPSISSHHRRRRGPLRRQLPPVTVGLRP